MLGDFCSAWQSVNIQMILAFITIIISGRGRRSNNHKNKYNISSVLRAPRAYIRRISLALKVVLKGKI